MSITLHANIMHDIEKFNKNLEKAKHGDSEAKFITAIDYLKAKGTQKDTKEGIYWLKSSAKDGYVQAIWLVAKINLSSHGKQDKQRAKKLLELLVNYEKYFPKQYIQNSHNVNKYKVIALMHLAELTQADEEKTTYYLQAFSLKESRVLSKEVKNEVVAYLDKQVKSLQKEILDGNNEKLFRYSIERVNLTFLKHHLSSIKNINEFYVINKYLPKKARYRVDMTLLLMAIQNDNLVMAKELLKHGADINLANSRGETPLLCAMRNRHIAFAKKLIKLGADSSILDNENNSVLSYALALGDEELALQVLQNKKFNIHEWVDGSVFNGKLDAYAEYISSKKSKDGMFSYLHLAAKNDAQKVIQKLIEMGLDINTTMRSDRMSLDALGIATRYASLESVKLLIKLGANPYVVYTNKHPEGNYGLSYWGGLSAKYTPLSMAVCREKRDKKIVEYFLSLKNAKWYVSHESEYFYSYLLLIKEAHVLEFFDENGFEGRKKMGLL